MVDIFQDHKLILFYLYLLYQVVRDIAGHIRKVKFKVIDLGMGKRVFTEKIISEDILGTNGYHAPEVLTDECYDFRADIFTLGITFCVMVSFNFNPGLDFLCWLPTKCMITLLILHAEEVDN